MALYKLELYEQKVFSHEENRSISRKSFNLFDLTKQNMREDSNKLFNLEISLTGYAVSYLAARKIVSIN